MLDCYTIIKKDKQIFKFCFYGFFKNLKFFEPYLIIYLLNLNFDLFQIGILIAIKEIVTYAFEIPSGIIADYYGKKKELLLCFSFYIISFIFFFLGFNFFILSVGMVFFGLGEAFRSGTHKAMILEYLEHKNWYKYKGFVYGRTRSYSLLGSSLSAFISIVLVLNLPSLKWIFLIAIIPYILDFLLILSYPNFLDITHRNNGHNKNNFINDSFKKLKSISKNKKISLIILSSSTYDAVFKAIKDYIQPILNTIILTSGVGYFMNFNAEDSLKIYLGIIYGIFYIFSSLVSKNIYKLSNKYNALILFNKMYDFMGIILITLSFTIKYNFFFGSVIIYFILYLMKDGRKPVFVDVSSDYMEKSQRVTVLSIESQIRAILMVFFAPLFGFIANNVSINSLFLSIGIIILIFNRILRLEKNILVKN